MKTDEFKIKKTFSKNEPHASAGKAESKPESDSQAIYIKIPKWLPWTITAILTLIALVMVYAVVSRYLIKSTIYTIAFYSDLDGDNEIYTIEQDGGNLTQITFNETDDWEPAWSPDGTKIAYASSQTGYSKIFMFNTINGTQTQLTVGYDSDWSPAWSSDGRYLIYVSDDINNFDFHKMHKLDVSTGETDEIFSGLDYYEKVSWSPDNENITFSMQNESDSEIYVMNTNTKKVVQLTFNSCEDWNPVWSPDGKHIAFESDCDYDTEIFLIDPDGDNLTQLTDNEFVDSFPNWSPDSKSIVFASYIGGNSEICKIDQDGSNLSRLTENDYSDRTPVWSPDGKQIAFVSDRDGDSEIFVMGTDGKDQTQLTFNKSNDWSPVWSSLPVEIDQ